LEDLLGFSGPDAPPEDVIRSCVHCGFCLPACPTYRETLRERSSPRGRIWLIKAVSEGRLDIRDQTFQEEMNLCLNCRACEAVCPSGVRYGELVESARAQIAALDPPPVIRRVVQAVVFEGVFASPKRYRAAGAALRLYQRTGVQELARKSGVLSMLGMEAQERMLPEMSERFLTPGAEHWPAQGQRRGTVALLAGCIMSTAYAEIHRATARVLARNGFDVIVPRGQGCCGALAVHAGDFKRGRRLAKSNIDAFDLPDVDAVLSNAAGCGAAMREYDFLLRNDSTYSQRAKRFTESVQDVTEFFVNAGLTSTPGALDVTVTYQEPCHLAHAQRVTLQPRQLLNAIPGLKLVEMAESALCCGSAGVYNVLQPEMSNALLERKLRNAEVTEAHIIVTANPGCLLQLQAGLQRRAKHTEVLHIMTLLDRAYTRLDDTGAVAPDKVVRR
jgi:glycolate oxidase iron-sulfur subunit